MFGVAPGAPLLKLPNKVAHTYYTQIPPEIPSGNISIESTWRYLRGSLLKIRAEIPSRKAARNFHLGFRQEFFLWNFQVSL